MTVNIYAAKTHLSDLIDRACSGEEIVIARNGRPVARLSAFRPTRGKRQLGRLKGRVTMAADFDAPLPEDLLAEFEGIEAK